MRSFLVLLENDVCNVLSDLLLGHFDLMTVCRYQKCMKLFACVMKTSSNQSRTSSTCLGYYLLHLQKDLYEPYRFRKPKTTPTQLTVYTFYNISILAIVVINAGARTTGYSIYFADG